MDALKNITPLRWLGIILIANATLAGGSTQLTTLFGPDIASRVLAVATLGSGFVGALVTMFGGQGAMIRNVRAMDGVENIDVNAKAGPVLAAFAMDPTEKKISVIPGAQAQVAATAKAAS